MIAGSPLSDVATPYMGPLVPDELLPETIAAFTRLVRRDHAAKLRLIFAYPVNPSVMISLRYRFYPFITLKISLRGRSINDLWQSMEKSCRAHVRQAEKRGVEITEAQSPEILEDYYRLEQKTFERQGRLARNPKEFYYALWDSLHPAGQMNVFVARCAGQTIGIQINAWYQGKLYGLHVAIDNNYRQYYPGNLLEWHLIEWAVKQGLEIYDMVDDCTLAGLARFKRSFGPGLVETPCFIRERLLSYKVAHWLLKIVRGTTGSIMN